MEEIQDYGKQTHVRCKACGRPIFVEGQTRVTVRDGQRFLTLECPVETCKRVFTYEENELEIHGKDLGRT
jgi:hypothetical protein